MYKMISSYLTGSRIIVNSLVNYDENGGMTKTFIEMLKMLPCIVEHRSAALLGLVGLRKRAR